MQDLTITDVTIVPMSEPGRLIERGYVTVRDGTIVQVASGSPDPPAGGQRLNGRGRVLMPGLVNAHTHLYQVLLRAVWEDLPLLPWLERIYGTAEVLNAEHVLAGTLLGCLESLKGGVTSLCEHFFLNPDPQCAVAAVQGIAASGVRAVFARTIMDAGDIVPPCTREKADTAFKHIEAIMDFHRGADGALRERITFRTGPNTPPINTTGELLHLIREFAKQHDLGISAHVAESCSVVERVQQECGKEGVVEYLADFGLLDENAVFAHCVHVSENEIELLAETRTSVSHNPVSNMMLGDGMAPVVEMLGAGVNVAVGTDGAASNHSQDLFETMKVMSLLQKVKHQNAAIIEPYAVLHAATVGGARALGLASLCGTVEVGKRADLILIDVDKPHILPINDLFSQLVHCAKATDVDTVMVGGRVLMEDRQLTSLNEEEVINQARNANADLLRRLAAAGH